MAVRVLIADDNLAFRDLLAGALRRTGGIELVGEAADGAEAVYLRRKLAPDVVILDHGMPRIDGLTAARIILRDLPSVIVYIMTALPRTLNRGDVLDTGVQDILDKYRPLAEIAAMVKSRST